MTLANGNLLLPSLRCPMCGATMISFPFFRNAKCNGCSTVSHLTDPPRFAFGLLASLAFPLGAIAFVSLFGEFRSLVWFGIAWMVGGLLAGTLVFTCFALCAKRVPNKI